MLVKTQLYIYFGCTQYETLILAINDSVFKDGKKVNLNERIGVKCLNVSF